MKLKKVSKYRKKLFSNFFFLFVVFAIAIGSYQFKREKDYRNKQLEKILVNYVQLVDNFITKNKISSKNLQKTDSLIAIIPQKGIRITIVNKSGKVLYDSFVKDYLAMENHLYRPEIQDALKEQTGKSIRHSNSTEEDYYYLAEIFDNYFIRAALPYEISVENYLKVNSVFIFVIFLIFILTALLLIYLSDRMGNAITQLRHFAEKAAEGKTIDIQKPFPDNELGMIAEQIVRVYKNLQNTKNELLTEKEKLFRHLQISHEGIAIFNKEKKQLLANNHFIQYLNLLSEDLAMVPSKMFKIKSLQPINDFIDEQLKKSGTDEKSSTLASNILTVQKNNKYFVVQAIVFNDLSFEISINDITKVEKEKKLKQQMTSNIAHELKTPVSSILGYLETLLNTKVEKEKRKFFLERSYIQLQRLTSLIQDISLLNKLEEANSLFELEEIDVKSVVNLIIDDLRLQIDEKNISVAIDLPQKIKIKGNRSVFFSIWRNLIENAVNYAGKNISIRIKNYLEDEQFFYFSFSDTGVGVEEKHLTRIFERFYRVDNGRSRSMGGTGLGLAIVKNGVLFHKGEISVKNLKNGGLEFVFSICKDLTNFK